MMLTKNIALGELTPAVPSAIQMLMFLNMATKLQFIRDLIKKPIYVTNGQRTEADYTRLLNSGYHPSETSDHYYGVPIHITTVDKVSLYGSEYCYSVGAVDFVSQIDTALLFKQLVDLVRGKKLIVGQLIHEWGNGKDWIHISNEPSLIYCTGIVDKYFNRQQLLESKDAGQTYQVPSL